MPELHAEPYLQLAATSFVETCNYCWVTGLAPDTVYRYDVIVKDEHWHAR